MMGVKPPELAALPPISFPFPLQPALKAQVQKAKKKSKRNSSRLSKQQPALSSTTTIVV